MATAIYATGPNGEFGDRGNLPFKCSADLKRFKAITMAFGTIVCGHNTYDSISHLEGRTLVVATTDEHLLKVVKQRIIHSDTKVLFRTLPEAMLIGDCFIGGAKLFNTVWPTIHKVYKSTIYHQAIGDMKHDLIFKPNLTDFMPIYAEKHDDHYFEALVRK